MHLIGFYHYYVNIKLYHWMTKSDPRHRATDALLSKILDLVDKFVEAYIAANGDAHFREPIPPIVIKPLPEEDIIGCLDSFVGYIREFVVPKTEGIPELTNLTDDMINAILQCKFLFRMH